MSSLWLSEGWGIGVSRFEFSDDTPGTDPWSDDDFGYRPFAEHLAEVLLGLAAPRGYVLGLHGAWGSGKTTALNYVRHFVRTKNTDQETPLEIVDFQPWMASGQTDLIATFFRVLADRIKEPADKLKRVRTVVGKTAKMAVDPLTKAAITLAAAAHPTETVAINAGGEIAKQAMNQTIDAWLGEPTLQAAHADLARRLRKSRRRFLVTIDDIDRLEPPEIRSIMQLVKSAGQLPNITYVLAYDRRVVWRALSERDAKRDGEPTFIEKIVQHEVELPHATRRALLRKLDRETKFILDDIQGGLRWNQIIESGLHRWIRHPRDVIRFSNALRFAWPPLKDEVDPADVLAMEGLRLFEPDVFDWIRSNRHVLADYSGYRSEEEQKAWGAALRASLPPSRVGPVVELLSILFPNNAAALRERPGFVFGESWADVVNRFGVATPRGFDAYFALFPSDHELPRSVVDRAVAAPGDQAVQDAAIADAMALKDEAGRSLVGDYLENLQFRLLGRHAIRPSPAMLRALVPQSDFIQRQDRDAKTFLPPYSQYHLLIRDMLKAWPKEEASAALVEAIDACGSAAAAAGLFVWRAREAGRLPDEGMETGPFITDDALDHIGVRTLALIHAEAESGRLAHAPVYWEIGSAWSHLENADVAREWLMSQAETDPTSLSKIAWGMLATSHGEKGLEYSFHGVRADHDLYDLDRLLKACERFAGRADLSPLDAARIEALHEGLRNRAAS